MIAVVNDASATLLSVLLVATIAVLGAVWRLGTSVGKLVQGHDDLIARVGRLEVHEDEHDVWHLDRGDR